MFLFFLFNCVILINLSVSQKYAATFIYDDLKCQNTNLITYSYENLEICDNDIILNKCNVFNKLSNFSMQSFCGFNSLDYTKKKFNNDFIYTEIFDNDCNKKTGAIALILNKCISFLGQTYIKIIKNKNTFNTKSYSDFNCKNEVNNNNTDNINQPIDLQKCLDKLKIYTKDGLLDNKNIENDNKKNNESNIENAANNEKHSMILTFSLMIVIIIGFVTNY